jgi:hypothetical protein
MFSGDFGLLDKLFELRLKVWELEQQNRYIDGEKVSSAYLHFSQEKIDEIIFTILKRSIQEQYIFGFFDIFDEHLIRDIINAKVFIPDGVELYYSDTILYKFYNSLFESMTDSQEQRDLWSHYFPDVLKIKGANLKPEFAKIHETTIRSYLDFAKKRLDGWEEGSHDWVLDKVTKGIFPQVFQPLWAFFVLLHTSVDSPQRALERYVKHGLPFGMTWDSVSVWGDVSDEEISRMFKEQEAAAVEQTGLLFQYFTFGYASSDKYLELCIEIAKNIEIEKGNEHSQYRKGNLEKILTQIKTFSQTKNEKVSSSEKRS